jgi:putative addiction module killer protein
MKLKKLVIYQTKDNKEPFNDWLFNLDNSVRGRVFARFRRIEEGNYGDHKRFSGLLELRFDFGKGYRIYCGEDGDTLVILLTARDKDTQHKDISKAVHYWEDYNEKKKI